jgi:Dolichyl-phosphate-mannose-protein mannosyltransferase
VKHRNILGIAALSVLVLYLGANALFVAAHKHLWYDELFTVAVARQGTPARVWSALEQCLDGQPPPFYLAEGAAAKLIPYEPVAYRMLPTIGYLLVSVCLFVFVRRRAGNMAGLIAAIIPPLSMVRLYPLEARPYGILLGCLALALVCWQRADRWLWQIGLAISLALAACAHYYAPLAFVPFGLAEVASSVMRRRIRWGVWAAFAVGILPALAFSPLLLKFKQYYGSSFWSKPGFGQIGAYDTLLNLPTGIGLGVAVVLALTIGVVINRARTGDGQQLSETPVEELLISLGFIAFPLIVLAITMIFGGGLTERYILATVMGIAAGAAFVLARLGRRAVLLALTFLACAFTWREARAVAVMVKHPPGPAVPAGQAMVRDILENSPDRTLPMVISSGLTYLAIAYYSAPDYADRVFNLVDEKKALEYVHTGSIEQALVLLRQYQPLHIVPFAEFAAAHPKFYLYSDGETFDWWPMRLSDDGYTFQTVKVTSGKTVYLVDLNKDQKTLTSMRLHE